MTLTIATPPPAPDDCGYSCNAWLAVEVAGQVFPNSRKVWFSMAFNPIANVDSSNPAEIYLVLSRAVQRGDVGSRIIRDRRSQLIRLVRQLRKTGQLSVQDARDYRREIAGASVSAFRPEVWRLDLAKIALRKYGMVDITRLKTECQNNARQEIALNPPQSLQPDEYLIFDLRNDEFETIIVG